MRICTNFLCFRC